MASSWAPCPLKPNQRMLLINGVPIQAETTTKNGEAANGEKTYVGGP